MQIQTQQLTNNLSSNNKEIVQEIKLPPVCWEVIKKATEESHILPKIKYTIDMYA